MKVVFLGTPEFAVPALKILIARTEVVAVYSQPDKPVGRGLKMQASPVKQVALEHGIPVFTPEKVSTDEEVKRILSYEPDFLVVVAYGQILKPSVINTPKIAIVNIHSSLLPRWRGAAPIQWALLGGDVETGITTMKIAPKLDAGDILLQAKTKISPEDTASSLHDRLSQMGGELILPTLEGLKTKTITPRVQNESEVTYAHKLTKEMERVDWNKSAKEFDRSVRALNPWPGVTIETDAGLRLKIKKGALIENLPGKPAPVGCLFSSGGELLLQCGSGAFQILELQEDGKKTIRGQDFINGLKGRGIQLPSRLKEGMK